MNLQHLATRNYEPNFTMSAKMKDFDPTVETWKRFVQRVKFYFVEEGIDESETNVLKRKAILFRTMGIGIFNKYCDIHAGEVEDATFDQIVGRIEAIVNPRPLEIAERFRFYTRRQQRGETAADYMAALRKLALTCNFQQDSTSPLNGRLRDQFVCGLSNADIQKYLLQQQELTVDNVVTFAGSFEAAEKTSVMLQASAPMPSCSAEISAVTTSAKHASRQSDKAFQGRCNHCGKVNHHHPDYCKFRNATCFSCTKLGHISSVCEQPRGKETGKGFRRNNTTRLGVKVQPVEMGDEPMATDEESNYVCTIENKQSAKILADLVVNGADVTLEVDTGTGVTLLTRRDWQTAGCPVLTSTKLQFRSYSGHRLRILGHFEASVTYNGKQFHSMPAYVVDSTRMSLLGRTWLDRMNLDIGRCRRDGEVLNSININAVNDDKAVKEIVQEFSALFDGSLGCIKDTEVSLQIDPNVNIRKFWPARRVPFALEKKVELELNRMEQAGIIEKINDDISEYASPIVVVSKRSTDAIRICGDFKVSVNKALRTEHYPLPRTEDLFAKLGRCKYFTKLGSISIFGVILRASCRVVY